MKKHNKIVILAKIKLNSIEKLVSQALINLEISHEECKSIINEKNYSRLKENVTMAKRSDEKDKWKQ